TTQVERTRIEQLDDQLRRLAAQADRLAVEREQLVAAGASAEFGALEEREQMARAAGEDLQHELGECLANLQALRTRQHETERELERARGEREKARAEVVSLDALQKAALGEGDRDAGKWLAAVGLASRPRVTAQLEVDQGWERSVEAVLGDALEAVQVDSLDEAAARIAELSGGQVMLVEGTAGGTGTAGSLADRVRGPAAVLRRLASVGTADSLQDALQRRHALSAEESLVTPDGVWVGRDWLRVARGRDAHAGVLERENRIRTLRGVVETSEALVTTVEARLAELRGEVSAAEAVRDQLQQRIQGAHREYSEARGALEAARGRNQQATERLQRLERETSDLAAERELAQQQLERSRAAFDEATARLEQLESRRAGMESEPDERRALAAAARDAAERSRSQAREILIQLEGRRSSESSLAATLLRMQEQRAQLTQRQEQLEAELAGGDEPIERLAEQLNELLARKLEIEGELSAARRDLENVDAELRALDEKRLQAE